VSRTETDAEHNTKCNCGVFSTLVRQPERFFEKASTEVSYWYGTNKIQKRFETAAQLVQYDRTVWYYVLVQRMLVDIVDPRNLHFLVQSHTCVYSFSPLPLSLYLELALSHS
jgi:hypothetical protein